MVVIVQVASLVLVLAFVLIFRNNLGLATSALFDSFGAEDVRVKPSEPAGGEGGDSSGGAADTDGASKEENQDEANTSAR